ncbi:MAG: bifunctional ornithine acetyltransferase/N-acetylglutamate synthase [Lachnospiraceae bacterium]|nr:bifunctional ornithine acetyltransferase/N-acetylglutamate synthase [Lachnospiraceae bacterium]
MKVIEGGVTAAKGYKAASTAAGIKYKDRTDMAMVISEVPAESAGVYTTNVVKAAPVLWDKKVTDSDKKVTAIVVNAGIANACTGKQGFDYCEQTSIAANEALGFKDCEVIVASTGVIGMQLPIEKLVAGTKAMVGKLDGSIAAGTDASKAIMTTDTVNKEIAVSFDIAGTQVVLGGMSKGSGMIHPNMCTMLGFLTTDCDIDKKLLQKALSEVTKDTFNMITVDGDTSTNDSLVVLANGLAKNTKITSEGKDYETFKQALYFVCEFLAKKMASDGEGATKLFEAKVVNAKTKEDARTLSRAIVGSNLSKAAIYGCDANFGRFLCAMGYSGSVFDQSDVQLYFESKAGKLLVFDMGVPLEFDEEFAVKIMKEDEVTVFVDMHEGTAEATAWGCDLTYDYVKINADYRS